MKLQKADIKLSNGKKFSIIHNLQNSFGLNIECALECWLARTEKYTAQSFCDYIKSKDTTFIAIPYDLYLKELKKKI